jgi:hypothetical protein
MEKIFLLSWHMYHRRYVTLLEMMLVIAILSLFAGLIGISVNKALVEQRFRNEVSMVVDELRLAQDLMLILNTDVLVKFVEIKDQGISCSLVLETRMIDKVKREIDRKPLILKTIKSLSLGNSNSSGTKGEAELKFISKGAVMSRGIIRLGTADEGRSSTNALESYICLAGYPRTIYSRDNKEIAEKELGEAEDAEFDKQLSEETFAMLPEKLKQFIESQPASSRKPRA